VAEIVRAAGYFPDLDAAMAPRDVELLIESNALDHGLVTYASRHINLEDAHNPRTFELTSEDDAEGAHWRTPSGGSLTKMTIARRLQLRDNLDDARRDAIYELTRESLLAALEEGPGGTPDLMVARGRGRGRGANGLEPYIKWHFYFIFSYFHARFEPA